MVCLFLLGLFTTVCSILRLTQIQRVAFGDGNSTMLVLWGTIEFNVGVSRASEPSCVKPFRLICVRILSPAPHTWPLYSRASCGISAQTAAKPRAITTTAGAEVMRWKTGPRTGVPSCSPMCLVQHPNVRPVRSLFCRAKIGITAVLR